MISSEMSQGLSGAILVVNILPRMYTRWCRRRYFKFLHTADNVKTLKYEISNTLKCTSFAIMFEVSIYKPLLNRNTYLDKKIVSLHMAFHLRSFHSVLCSRCTVQQCIVVSGGRSPVHNSHCTPSTSTTPPMSHRLQ